MPTPGGPDDFRELVGMIASSDFSQAQLALRALFAVRWHVGKLLGWDSPKSGLGARVAALRDGLPPDLRDLPPGPSFGSFTALYLTDDEFAAEIANRTVHGVLHLGWVRDEPAGVYRGQMAVYAKPDGRLGSAYMAAITPFRRLIVYPLMLRQIGRRWQSRSPCYHAAH